MTLRLPRFDCMVARWYLSGAPVNLHLPSAEPTRLYRRRLDARAQSIFPMVPKGQRIRVMQKTMFASECSSISRLA